MANNDTKIDNVINKLIEYIDWYKEYDSSDDEGKRSLLLRYSNEIASLLIETKTKTETYFKQIVDQPIYKTSDYLRLRKFLIYWYASFNTISSQEKKTSDINFIDKGLLLRSLGYELYTEHSDIHQKTLCTQLSDIWAQKGTHLAMSKMTSMLDISNFTLYEYWLDRDTSDNQLRFTPTAIQDLSYSTGSLALDPPPVKPFSTVVQNDPHWYMTEADIAEAEANNEIGMPSLTPYVGVVSANDWIKNSKFVTAYANRICNDTYEDYLNNPNFNLRDYQKYYFYVTSENISMFELYLSIGYVYNSIYNRKLDARDGETERVFHFNDSDETLYDEVQYITEFNKVFTRAYSNKTKKELLEKAKTDWQTLNPITCWTYDESKQVLNEVSPMMYSVCNQMIDTNQGYDFLIELLTMFDYYISHDLGLTAYTSLFMLYDPLKENQDKIKKVFDHFKPIHTRLLDSMSYMIVNDIPGDCVAIDDNLKLTLDQTIKELYDYIYEKLKFRITARYFDDIGRGYPEMFPDMVEIIMTLKVIEPRIVIEDKKLILNMKQLFVEFYLLFKDKYSIKMLDRFKESRLSLSDSFNLRDMKEKIKDEYYIPDVVRKPLYKLNVENYILYDDKVEIIINDTGLRFNTETWSSDMTKEYGVKYSDDTHPAYSQVIHNIVDTRGGYVNFVRLNTVTDVLSMTTSGPFYGRILFKQVDFSNNITTDSWDLLSNNQYIHVVDMERTGVSGLFMCVLLCSEMPEPVVSTLDFDNNNHLIRIISNKPFEGRLVLLSKEISKTFSQNDWGELQDNIYPSTLSPMLREGTYSSKEYIVNVLDANDQFGNAEYNYTYSNKVIRVNLITVM